MNRRKRPGRKQLIPRKNRDKRIRLRRKDEHLFFAQGQRPGFADFTDIHFIHNCLPELNIQGVTICTSLLGKVHRSPLFINAVTGGTRRASKINADLAWVAKKSSLPMAVGSQLVALDYPPAIPSFKVVRQVNPAGEIWANLGGYATPEQARRAIEMVNADALQIHLNVPQELAMAEGDTSFRGILNRIAEIVVQVNVPVIVKEVGFGIAREEAQELKKIGVAAIDVGGKGGTNFIKIEQSRQSKALYPSLQDWGLPTAITLIESLTATGGKVDIFAAGGMASALNIAKALALGAAGIGLAAWPVYILLKEGRTALLRKIQALEQELRAIMLLVGAADIAKLQEVPLVITGFTAEWLRQRGLDPGARAPFCHPCKR
ncbi:MAG: type 2 isopentenyl-diphosphate Delta-isomerase [Firmicutes bacterium]|nr:type 2 isopentenyl-diphosphate Delta-isomerase [Bacillota bacterium]